MPLTAEQIKGKPDDRLFPIDIPEWKDENGDSTYFYKLLNHTEGKKFRVRFAELLQILDGKKTLSHEELEAIRVLDTEHSGNLIVKSLVDKNGHRIFSDNDVEHVVKFPADVVAKITKVLMLANGFTSEDGDEKKS